MPNYGTHTALGFTVLSGLSYACVSQLGLGSNVVTPAALGFGFATVMLSPDLDLKYSSPTKNWKLLRWLWRPYQLLFRHRGLSHSILFSTITRMVYLTCMLALVYMAGYYLLAEVANFENMKWDIASAFEFSKAQVMKHLPEVAAAGIGVLCSDWCHIIADRLFSALKILVKF